MSNGADTPTFDPDAFMAKRQGGSAQAFDPDEFMAKRNQLPAIPAENLPGATPSLLRSARPSPLTQPTQFEKDRPGKGITTEGMGGAAWDTLKRMVPADPTGGRSLLDPKAWLDVSFDPAKSGLAEAGRETKAGWQRGGADVRAKLGEGVTSGLGSLFAGVSGRQMAEEAARGEGGKILGQAAVPAAVAAAPLAAEGMGVLGRPVAKVLGRTARGAVEPFGIGVSGEELLKKGVSPRASALGWDQSVARAGQDLASYHKQTPIQSVADLNEAVPKIQQTIMDSEVKPVVARHAKETLAPERMARVSQAVKDSVGPFAEEFDPSAADAARGLADKMSRARTIGDVMGGPRGGLLSYVNAKLESYFAKYPSARSSDLMKNPDTAMWEAARRQLREEALDHLEQAGEQGIRGARQRWGALEDIQKEVERRVNVADRQKPIGLYRMLGVLTALPTAGLGLVAGETARYLNEPNVLVRRGLSKMGRSEPPQLLGKRGAK